MTGPDQPPPAEFASTQWSIVLLAAGERESSAVREALARLCSTYWYPLYVFIRRQGHAIHDAEELTQEFFARLLEKDLLNKVDQGRGRFRTFLLACCRHFLANQCDYAKAQKRGGGQLVLSLDFSGADERYRAEPVCTDTAERSFERRWALTVLDQVMARLQHDYEAEDNRPLFDRLETAIVGDSDALSYSRIGNELGMNEPAVRKAAQRLRQRYRALLRQHIADTVHQPHEIDEEIRALFAALV